MRADEIVESVKRYDKKADLESLRRACLFAEKMHHEQRRETGEQYFIHPLAVAEILLEYKMDAETIIAALLHDTVEDTPASYESIRALFGKSVAVLVQGLTKLESYQLQSTASEQAENFQKLILASSKDIRILLIKLADRLHNMRTLGICSAEKKRRKAQETMDIYVPLAERLGLHKIKTELEDLSFRELNPSAYANITKKLEEMQSKHKTDVASVIKEIEKTLAQNKIKGRMMGRVKMPYSLWHKLQKHDNEMAAIFDVVGVRVIVKNIQDCYRVLGLVHSLYRAIPGRFKDYISTPKDSGYRSLQTSVLTSKGVFLEIQIRTEEMEDEAMYGIAAHWSYKQGVKYDGRQLPWMKEFLNLISDSQSPAEFLKRAKLHMYTDKLFCFDAQGMLYSLPQGATVLDFACYQGSKVALKCVSCEVNEKSVPLNTALKDGDKVVFRLSSKIVAEKGWMKIVTTAYARTLIENYFAETPKIENKVSFFSRFWPKKTKEIGILGLPSNKTYELDTVCDPHLGDAIVGIEEGNKVVIHKRTCGELKKYVADKNRWLSVEWNVINKKRNKLTVSLLMTWKTHPESMGEVVSKLTKMKAKIEALVLLSQEHKVTKAQVDVSVRNNDHLLDVLDALHGCKTVLSVYQVKDEQ